MVTKVFDAGEFFVEYDIRPQARKYTFTDTSGREVTMTELGFYDFEFVTEMGFTNKHQIAVWWKLNRNNQVLTGRTHTFDENLYRYFEGEVWGDCERYVRSPEELFTFIHQDRHGSPTFLLVQQRQEGQAQEKPTYSVQTWGWGAQTYLNSAETSTPQASPSVWSTKKNYSFKMSKDEHNFFRKLDKESDEVPFYGMELELCTKLSSQEIYHIVAEVEPKQEPFFIFKDDSSISGRYYNKYELVTVPCTRKYLRKAWKTLFDKLEKLCQAKGETIGDYFDTRRDLSNGIHIHVSKDKFLGEFHKSKFLAAWNQWDSSNVDFMTKISGRPHEKFNQNSYCPIDGNFEGRTLARRLKRRVGTSQRSVCHTQNSATLEVRLYQGIVDVDHILRCLDHVDAMFEFTSLIGMKTFGREFVHKFEEFVLKGNKYRSLRQFITETA